MSEFNFDRTMDENTVYKFNKYFYEIRMGKFCNCRLMDIVHYNYSVGQIS